MKTIILTGLWNTGKDCAAKMLETLGVNMHLGVQNDYFPRNDDELVMFWNECAPVSMHQIFTNPSVIIMQRDLEIVHRESGHAREEIAEEIARSLHWARKLLCPVLHLSSETMFRTPVDAMLAVHDFLK